MKLFSSESKFTYVFHYIYDNGCQGAMQGFAYERCIDANEDEEAFRKFFADRPEASQIWYERYRKVEHLDGTKCLVLDM